MLSNRNSYFNNVLCLTKESIPVINVLSIHCIVLTARYNGMRRVEMTSNKCSAAQAQTHPRSSAVQLSRAAMRELFDLH